MLNDFLSDILKIVIVLDVLGVIAYFVLGLKTKKAQPVAASVPEPEEAFIGTADDLCGPGFLNPAVAAADSPPLPVPATGTSLWRRLRSRLHRRQRTPSSPVRTGTLDEAMSRLRRVLNSYETGLST